MNDISYPQSFPNETEEKFLRVVLSDDAGFPSAWSVWKSQTPFEEVDFATSRLMPLVYLRMQKLGMHDDPLFGKIKGIYRSAWVVNQRFLSAVKDIAGRCEQKNIPIVLLKGLPLLLDVYQDPGARFTGDADIFSMPEYAPAIVTIMQEGGWKYSKPWMPDVSNPVPSMYNVTKSTDFTNAHAVPFDVHWNIFGLYHHANPWDILFLRKNVPTLAFRSIYWESAIPLTSGAVPARRLSNEDMLIHVIVHGVEGNVTRTLRWVTDAAAIIEKLPIDWHRILNRSQQFGMQIELFIGFRYLSERMEVAIPRTFLHQLSQVPFTKRQLREFQTRANLTGGERFSPINNLLMFWYAYWMYEPASDTKSVFGFVRYAARSLGMNRPGIFSFIIRKYVAKMIRRVVRTTPAPTYEAAES